MQYISLSSTSDKFRILQCEYTTQIKHIKKQYYMRKFRRQRSISAIIISGWFLMLNFYDNFSYLSQYSTYTLIFHHSNFTNSSFCQSDSGILCTTWIIYCPDIFKDVFFFFWDSRVCRQASCPGDDFIYNHHHSVVEPFSIIAGDA